MSLDPNSLQVGGDHYRKYGSLQPWDALQNWLSPEAFKGYLMGDIIAYLVRHKDKGGVEDLRKAHHVLGKLIEVSEDEKRGKA